MQGFFPAYDNIIQTNTHNKTLIVKRQSLQEAIERAELVLTPQKPTVILTLEHNMMVITGESDTGTVTEAISIECEMQGSLQFGFSPRYLIDCCHTLKTPYMKWSFVDSNKPIIVTGIQAQTTDPLYDIHNEIPPVTFAIMTMKTAQGI